MSILISMHISNRFVVACNIRIVIWMLKNIDHSIISLISVGRSRATYAF